MASLSINQLLGIADQNKKKKDQPQTVAAPATLNTAPGAPMQGGILGGLNAIAARNRAAAGITTPAVQPQQQKKANTGPINLNAKGDENVFTGKDALSALGNFFINGITDGVDQAANTARVVKDVAQNAQAHIQGDKAAIQRLNTQTANDYDKSLVKPLVSTVKLIPDAFREVTTGKPNDPISAETTNDLNSSLFAPLVGVRNGSVQDTGQRYLTSVNAQNDSDTAIKNLRTLQSQRSLLQAAGKSDPTLDAAIIKATQLSNDASRKASGAVSDFSALDPEMVANNAANSVFIAEGGYRTAREVAGDTRKAIVAAQDARHTTASQETGVTREQFDAFRNGDPNAGITPQQFDLYRNSLRRQDQAGFVDLGGVKENPADDASAGITQPDEPVIPAVQKPFQQSFVDEQVAAHKNAQEYADRVADNIWIANKKGQGVDFINNDFGAGETNSRRISNNTPFYRDYYEQYGTKPSRKAVKDMVDQVITGKQGEYDANVLRRSLDPEELAAHENIGQQLNDRTVIPEPTIPALKVDTVTAFDNSKGQTPLAGGRDADFEIGDFGRNALTRKADKPDRLTETDIAETIPHLDRVYNASDNVGSYRSDNKAWVGTMPDGENRVVYTRRNAAGKEEVINAHSIKSVPKYEDTLKSFGTPARSRTGNVGLERQADNPINGSARTDKRDSVISKGSRSTAPQAEEGRRTARPAQDNTAADPSPSPDSRTERGVPDESAVDTKQYTPPSRKSPNTPIRQQSLGEIPKVGEEVPSSSSISDATPISKVINDKRTGEKFAKPQKGFARSKGRVEQNGGVVLRESESGNQRQILMTNNLGERVLTTETKQPDGTWSSRKNQNPAIEFPDDYTQIDNIEKNRTLQDAVKTTAESGDELHFYAAKNVGDPNARSAEVVRIDPSNYIIDGGFVRDAKTNAILGNHIVVDPSGMAINIGKNIINMDSLVGNTVKWKDTNHGSWTLDRIIEAAAPTREAYDKMHTFLIKDKNAHEAKMRVDLADYRNSLLDKRRELLRSKPAGLKKQEFFTDVFHYAERKLAPDEKSAGKMLSQEQLLETKYGRATASKIKAFDTWARKEYDSLLDRTNETLREFGHDEVPKRQNYMTHLQEDSLWDKIGIGEDLWRDLSSGISGESNPTNRGKLPGTIVGRTEEFKPTKKYNPFHQTRRGNDSMTDPFKAMDAYGEAALFNIHMTEPAVRARSVESAFRVAEEVTNADLIKTVSKDLRGAINQRYGGNKPDLISAFQEYANALSGKSSSIDRVIQDKLGATGRTTLRMSRLLQKVASQSTIVGNVSVTLSQALNPPNVIGTNGVRNFMKGVGHTIGDGGFTRDGLNDPNAPISKSNFMRTRYTDASSRITETRLHKMNETVSKALLMKQAEKAFAEIAWNSSYARATGGKTPLKGQAAINEADRLTERLIAGRGIGDQPEIYRSTIGRTFLQYTLEVNAAFKNVTKDMTPVGLIKYAVAVYALNLGMEQITGRKPLPDFLGVGIDTAADFLNGNDDPKDDTLDNVVQAGQRTLNAVTSMSPILSAGANIFLSQDLRKKLFGADSNLGRFDGSVAAAGVAGNLITAVGDLVQGKFEQAGKDAASVLPYGGQAKKSYEGVKTMVEGVAQNSNGTPIAAVDTSNPAIWIKAALFGKNAIPEVKAYYDGKNSPLSAKQVEEYNDIKTKQGDAAAQKFVDDTYTDKVDRLKEKQEDAKKETDKNKGGLEANAGAATTDIAGAAKDIKKELAKKQKAFKDSFSDDDYALYTLNNAARKQAIEKGLATQEKFDQLDAYAKTSKQRNGLSVKDKKPASEVLDPKSKEYEILDDARGVETADKKNWNRKQIDPKYQGMIDDINKSVPAGLPKVPSTNAVASLYAKFVEDKTSNQWGELELNKKTEELVKSSYKTELTDNQQFINGLSDSEILSAANDGKISKADLDAVMSLDSALKSLGFSQNFGNTLRKKLGYGTLSSSSSSSSSRSSGSRSSSGRKTSATKAAGFKFPSQRFNRVSHATSIYKLLSSAGRGIK